MPTARRPTKGGQEQEQRVPWLKRWERSEPSAWQVTEPGEGRYGEDKGSNTESEFNPSKKTQQNRS